MRVTKQTKMARISKRQQGLSKHWWKGTGGSASVGASLWVWEQENPSCTGVIGLFCSWDWCIFYSEIGSGGRVRKRKRERWSWREREREGRGKRRRRRRRRREKEEKEEHWQRDEKQTKSCWKNDSICCYSPFIAFTLALCLHVCMCLSIDTTV